MAYLCPYCSSKSHKHGKTSSSKQRWRCTRCNSTFVVKRDDRQKNFSMFLNWLLGSKTQQEMDSSARTFRRKTSEFWKIWPAPYITGTYYSCIQVDGIYLSRSVVILIATAYRGPVLRWHIARSESSHAYRQLLRHLVAPRVVITDGQGAIHKAIKDIWPFTLIQRCTYHVYCQIKRATTTRPRLECGQELLALGKQLICIRSKDEAHSWLVSYLAWDVKWLDFLKETTKGEDGKLQKTHLRLWRIRVALNRLISSQDLFRYIDLQDELADTEVGATNNYIEGAVNKCIRDVLRHHSGLCLIRRVKAVFWWCYMHSEEPLSLKDCLI